MIFKKLLGKLIGNKKTNKQSAYQSVVEFVDDNLVDVKKLLSSTGYNDVGRHLSDIATSLACNVVFVARKLSDKNKFEVVETSNKELCPRRVQFDWVHLLPIGSSDAQNVINSLPFKVVDGKGFISVPIKNKRNILVGLLIGISSNKLVDLDSKTRLLHILAPSFEAEVRCAKLRQDAQQYEQRIVALNQNIEIMNSDLQNEQERSLESKELKSVFLTNLSQEIRTPINVIVGFCDLLRDVENEEERQNFSNIIKQNSLLLLSVVDNLIEISKLQSSYLQKVACPVQLNALLDKLKKRYEDILKKDGKSVVIETNYALDTPNDTIWNSDIIITKVMEQLLSNSCKYTSNGTINISYTINHREATFCVTDTGIGIEPGKEEKVFDLFDTDDITSDSTNTKIKGIGLAFARKYISLVNGNIWVDPSYKLGTSIYFTIPTEKL